MTWKPHKSPRVRELEAEARDLRRSLVVVERSHEVLKAENYALADMVRELEADVEDWQVRWGEAIRDADEARETIETYARALRQAELAVQEESHERTLNVVTGEWP